MVGVGTDIVAVDRIAGVLERHGERFVRRCFRADEIALAAARGRSEAATLAARWAAKEAFLKALGSGLGTVAMRDIEVVRGESGEPQLRLHGTAARLCAQAGGSRTHVSLSHERKYAVAVVVIE
jgi:holo-[acyl-carrier protein] synthase